MNELKTTIIIYHRKSRQHSDRLFKLQEFSTAINENENIPLAIHNTALGELCILECLRRYHPEKKQKDRGSCFFHSEAAYFNAPGGAPLQEHGCAIQNF